MQGRNRVAFWELAHRKAYPILDLYGDSRDWANAVREVHGEGLGRGSHPIEIWNEVGTSIVQNTFESYTNPQLAGKDKQLWLSNYRIVETQSLRKLLNRR